MTQNPSGADAETQWYRPINLLKAVGALAVVWLVFQFGASTRLPSDEMLRAGFERHHDEFDGLREMILAEPKVRVVGFDQVGAYRFWERRWVDDAVAGVALDEPKMLAAVGLASDRYQTYRERLRAIDAVRVSMDSQDPPESRVTVELALESDEAWTRTKRIIHSPRAPAPMASDTDEFRTDEARGSVYSPLGDNWYIELEWR